MLGKRIAWIFVFTISALIAAFVFFLQSSNFARIAKAELQRHITPIAKVGIDFSRIKVGFFPPSLSLANVKISAVSSENPIGLAPGVDFTAERVGVTFRMLQAFGSGITINKLFVYGAKYRGTFAGDEKKPTNESMIRFKDIAQPLVLRISNSFNARIIAFDIRDCSLDLKLNTNTDDPFTIKVKKVTQLSVRPESDWITTIANLEGVQISSNKEFLHVDFLRANLDIGSSLTKVNTLDMQRGELAINAQGKLIGSLEDLKKIKADLKLLMRSRAEALEEFTPLFAGVTSEINGEWKISGGLSDYRVAGDVTAKQFGYQMWELDSIQAKVVLTPNALDVNRLALMRAGGELSVENFQLPLKLTGEHRIEFKFKNVDFHQYAGNLRRTVNNLEAKLNGKAYATLVVSGDKRRAIQRLTVTSDIMVNSFSLNNQTFQKIRPRKDIFGFKSARLLAKVNVEGERINIDGTEVKMESGNVLASGFITTKGVFDLRAKSSENVNWTKEVEKIAEIPLVAQGSIGLHVHGPDSRVFLDFEANLSGLEFLNLHMGAVGGKIRLDDRESIITLSDLRGKKSESIYTLDGTINLETEKIDLYTSFQKATPNDIFAIFQKQLRKLTWIPWDMTGEVIGYAKIGGDFGNSGQNLEVVSRLSGTKLIYKGEAIQELSADAGFFRGNYYARAVRAKKYNSLLTGELEYSKDDVLQFSGKLQQGKVRDFDYLSTRGFPVDASIGIETRGRGRVERLDSFTTIKLEGAHLQARALPPIKLSLKTEEGNWNIIGKVGEDLANLEINLRQRGKPDLSDLQLQIKESDQSFLLCALNSNLCRDSSARLEFPIEAQLSWPAGDWRRATGRLQLKRILAQKSGFTLASTRAGFVEFSDGSYALNDFELVGPSSRLLLSLAGNISGSRVNWGLGGETSLKLLEFFTPLVEEAQGRMATNLRLLGRWEEPRFEGGLTLSGGFIRPKGLDATAESLSGKIIFANNRANLVGVNTIFGGGKLDLKGSADLFLHKAPVLNLEVIGRDNRLKFFPVSYAEVEDMQLSFAGERPPYLFSGLAKMRKAIMRKNFDLGRGQKQLQSAKFLPARLGRNEALYEVKIRAVADGGMLVENDLLDAEFRGEVTLLNNFEFPQVIGKAELVRGRLLFRNTYFILDHAMVRLPSPEIFRPQFSVGGVTTVNNFRISLFASGTPEDPKISFSANPPLPQGDILSLLAFGFKGEDTKGVRENDLSAITYSEVGSILLEQLRISKDLQSRGFRLNVVPTVSDNEANIVRPRSAADAASPKIVMQTQVLKKLEASVGATVGTTQNQKIDGSLEYHLGKRASLSGVFEQEQQLDSSDPRSSYGADLKFRWGFK